jgi:hypothetical protein
MVQIKAIYINFNITAANFLMLFSSFLNILLFFIMLYIYLSYLLYDNKNTFYFIFIDKKLSTNLILIKYFKNLRNYTYLSVLKISLCIYYYNFLFAEINNYFYKFFFILDGFCTAQAFFIIINLFISFYYIIHRRKRWYGVQVKHISGLDYMIVAKSIIVAIIKFNLTHFILCLVFGWAYNLMPYYYYYPTLLIFKMLFIAMCSIILYVLYHLKKYIKL